MNLAQILERFDHERRELEFPYAVREATDRLVRHVDRYGSDSAIVFSSHNAQELAGAVAKEINYFHHLGHDFEWKAYSHDDPADLVERLGSLGFEIGPREVVVVAQVAEVLSRSEDASCEVRRLADAADLADYEAVTSKVWPEEEGAQRLAHLAEQMRSSPESVGAYVAYCDGIPVGCARSSFHRDSLFTGFWGGSVLPEYRRRGIYRSMISRRAKDAAARGVGYLRVDALPTSLPILERLGFQRLSVTHPCVWRCKDRSVPPMPLYG